jgi:hypothetical protein
VAGNCSECGSALEVTDVVDTVGEFSELADKGDSRIAFIPMDFDEGSQLMIALAELLQSSDITLGCNYQHLFHQLNDSSDFQ